MKVGLDLDNTITAAPWFYAALTSGLHHFGHQIFIISFRDDSACSLTRAKNELKEHKIIYDHIMLAPISEINIGKWKARIIDQYRIDLMIDDMPEVLAVASERCQKLWVCSDYDLSQYIESLKDMV